MRARRAAARATWHRSAVLAASVVVAVGVWASPASAHAQLLSTSPAAGSVLATSPAQVALRFGEPVEIDFGSIRIFDSAGARVDAGGTHHPGGDDAKVAVSLPAHLRDGAYVVSWRVVSADSHPVQGAFTFSVGNSRGLARASALAGRLGKGTGGEAIGAAYLVVRAAGFAGLLGLVGIAAVATAFAPGALRRRRVRAATWASYGLLGAATVLGVCLQGAYAAELTLASVFRASLIGEVLTTRYGHLAIARLALLAVAAPLLAASCSSRGRGRPRAPVLWAGAAVGVGLLTTTALAGHAATGTWVAAGLVADLVHLAAAATWIGGLVVLACLLVPGGDVDQLDLDATARRVSTALVVAVVAVVASGSLQALREVGAIGDLVDTDFGRLLLAKVGLVAVLVGLGALSRSRLRGGSVSRSAALDRGALTRSVAVELVVMAAVVVVTAGLINAAPPRELASLPYTQTYTTLGVQVNVVVSPAAAGVRNTMHIYVLAPSGLPRAVPEVDAALSYPAENIGPLQVPLQLAGVGHYRSRDVTFIASGTWILTVTVRTTAIDEQATPLQVPVR